MARRLCAGPGQVASEGRQVGFASALAERGVSLFTRVKYGLHGYCKRVLREKVLSSRLLTPSDSPAPGICVEIILRTDPGLVLAEELHAKGNDRIRASQYPLSN
ncbi:uncharacterized protein JN550_002257 [Neoarthrinium moseri]|uniref:uncharacterized protein n=1 Tax=Neoarthrinium moseri TaxID=1658444 RepID=UPI001FDCEDFC|nr:uncharacterized protein JN550_002257 [Neoarthrinium moseri]KAI1874828.1 hypothetical protein JN550_002257 [Neoarthrinium moseri]